MRNEKGQFVKGHPKPKNAYSFPKGYVSPTSFEKGHKDFVTREAREIQGLKMIGRKVSEETRRKMSESQKRIGNKPPVYSGKDHYMWKNDRTKIKQYWTERNNPEYKQWRKGVLLIDGFKCRMDSNSCDGNLIVHHILSWRDYPEERYNIKNGITLCHFHHPRKRSEEERLIPFFQELVEVR